MVKTLDNFKIVTKSGITYDMAADFGVLVHRFAISSPKPDIVTDKVDNRNGLVRLGKTWGSRSITAICSFVAVDSYDVALLRSDVFKTVMNLDEFYVICDAEPGKRWLAEVASEWTPERAGTYAEFSLEFVSHNPYSESVGTTLDPKTFDSGLWQTGQGLVLDETYYRQTTTAFQIFNAEDGAVVDPRELPLVITYNGASTNLVIKNVTTGDEWTYTGTTASGDNIVLDGIRSTKNSLTIFGNTNRKLITLAPGWNDFQLSGTTTPFEITFDFRFYTL